MFVEWSEDIAVHHGQLDTEHKYLIGIINELHDAIADGRGREVIADTLTRLADYTIWHFDREEQIMRRVGYPHLDEHVAQHGALIDELGKRAWELEVGEDAVTERTMAFLKDWIYTHLRTDDRNLVKYINATARPAA
jgi:hemerythrin